MIRVLPRLVVLLAPLVLAACASPNVPWQNPDIPKEEWSRDWNACRRWAESQVGYREENGDGPFRDYDRGRAKRQADAYVNACMRERGYFPKPSK